MRATDVKAVLEAVLAADDLLLDRLYPVLSAHGLSIESFRAVRLLAESEHGCTVGDICRRIGASPPATTRTIDRLVASNIAYRRVDDLDRRRVLVYLSGTGREVWQSLIERIDA